MFREHSIVLNAESPERLTPFQAFWNLQRLRQRPKLICINKLIITDVSNELLQHPQMQQSV